jgi:hypothetical protein
MMMQPSPSNKPAAYAFSASVSISASTRHDQETLYAPLFSGAGCFLDIHSRIQVRVGGEPTRDTEEVRLRRTIGLLTMPTATTGLARMGRVHQHHRYTGQRRLIGDEDPKLTEGPAMQHSPLARRTVNAATDVLFGPFTPKRVFLGFHALDLVAVRAEHLISTLSAEFSDLLVKHIPSDRFSALPAIPFDMVYLESANVIVIAAACAVASQRLYCQGLHIDSHGAVIFTLHGKVLVPILAPLLCAPRGVPRRRCCGGW